MLLGRTVIIQDTEAGEDGVSSSFDGVKTELFLDIVLFGFKFEVRGGATHYGTSVRFLFFLVKNISFNSIAVCMLYVFNLSNVIESSVVRNSHALTM